MACLWLYELGAAPGGARALSSRPIGFQRHPTPCVESSLRIFAKHPASHGQLPQRTARGKKGSPKVPAPAIQCCQKPAIALRRQHETTACALTPAALSAASANAAVEGHP